MVMVVLRRDDLRATMVCALLNVHWHFWTSTTATPQMFGADFSNYCGLMLLVGRVIPVFSCHQLSLDRCY